MEHCSIADAVDWNFKDIKAGATLEIESGELTSHGLSGIIREHTEHKVSQWHTDYCCMIQSGGYEMASFRYRPDAKEKITYVKAKREQYRQSMENSVTALLRIWRKMVFWGIRAEGILENWEHTESILNTGYFQWHTNAFCIILSAYEMARFGNR